MGIKLIILLALLVGVLYSLHLLVQDYQALTAPRLLRFLFKRDVSSINYTKPTVRWKRILMFDPIQCARYLYCDMGVQTANDTVRRGFILMLKVTKRFAKSTVKLDTILTNLGKQLQDLKILSAYSALEPKPEDRAAWEVFKEAYNFGNSLNLLEKEKCHVKYSLCPFHSSLLFDLINYLLRDKS